MLEAPEELRRLQEGARRELQRGVPIDLGAAGLEEGLVAVDLGVRQRAPEGHATELAHEGARAAGVRLAAGDEAATHGRVTRDETAGGEGALLPARDVHVRRREGRRLVLERAGGDRVGGEARQVRHLRAEQIPEGVPVLGGGQSPNRRVAQL